MTCALAGSSKFTGIWRFIQMLEFQLVILFEEVLVLMKVGLFCDCRFDGCSTCVIL